ncbi:MAG: glycosyltransferase family 4 protein [Candidatus Thiodiazotropha sp. (ex Epidulcina cf. delphinae)]|nr:glycosyltransferase family 4 protein [Candidatus Thiodiazotropha sp. (ex Epidulcina cf. delphinae)]
MKVLHVEAGMHLYGGARQVAYLLSGLRQQGVESILVCPIGSAIGQLAGEIIETVHELPMRGDYDLALIWRLRRIIRQERPELVHLHSRRGADILGGLAASLTGVKTVLSRRVDNPESPLVVKWKYRLYDRIIPISQGIAEVMLREGVPEEKLVCVRSAVDVEAFQQACDRAWFSNTFGLAEDALVIGVVAQLIPRKGHRYLLEAMPRLLEAFPNLRLLIFGRGPLAAELEARIVEMKLQEQVMLAGFREDLPAILPCLDLLVHPALMEGLGIALLQAASAGLPIVAVDAGGMPEVVEDGVNGRLIPPGSVEALEDAVRQLLTDEDLRRRMGASGREKMRQHFSVARMVDGNLSVYRELLSQEKNG